MVSSPFCWQLSNLGVQYVAFAVVFTSKQTAAFPFCQSSELGDFSVCVHAPLAILQASSVGKVPLVDLCESDEAMGIYCHVCEVFVEGLADEHVYRAHLNETMYRCPLCDFSSKHSKQGVLDHMDQSHGDVHPWPPLISLEEKFRHELANWNRLCWEKQERSEMVRNFSRFFVEDSTFFRNCRHRSISTTKTKRTVVRLTKSSIWCVFFLFE
jgi:hypothetical protein